MKILKNTVGLLEVVVFRSLGISIKFYGFFNSGCDSSSDSASIDPLIANIDLEQLTISHEIFRLSYYWMLLMLQTKIIHVGIPLTILLFLCTIVLDYCSGCW